MCIERSRSSIETDHHESDTPRLRQDVGAVGHGVAASDLDRRPASRSRRRARCSSRSSRAWPTSRWREAKTRRLHLRRHPLHAQHQQRRQRQRRQPRRRRRRRLRRRWRRRRRRRRRWRRRRRVRRRRRRRARRPRPRRGRLRRPRDPQRRLGLRQQPDRHRGRDQAHHAAWPPKSPRPAPSRRSADVKLAPVPAYTRVLGDADQEGPGDGLAGRQAGARAEGRRRGREDARASPASTRRCSSSTSGSTSRSSEGSYIEQEIWTTTPHVHRHGAQGRRDARRATSPACR